MTRLLRVDFEHPDHAALAEAAAVIRAGGLVAFATETVYGLGADATNPDAVARIFEAKGRPATNPLIVHVENVAMARRCVAAWPDAADRCARACWPGPLTLVLPRSPLIPDLVTAGRDTVGVRVPSSPVALGLIHATGRPIAAPSANRSNRISPTRAEHVRKGLSGRIDLILDSGPTPQGIESTVLDLTHGPPYRVLRPGPLTAEDLVGRTGLRIDTWDYEEKPAGGSQKSPGRLPVHYAPTTLTVRLEIGDVAAFSWPGRAALIVVGPHVIPSVPEGVAVVSLTTPEQAAAQLYDAMHRCDESECDLIAIVPPPDQPAWRAVRDRIVRASRPA